MQLYFSPMACSMATRIALYEAGGQATYIEVDPKSKRTSDGQDFRTIHPLGLVPTIRTDDGDIVTENAAILQYVARRHPSLTPATGLATAKLQQWLCFIGTELHKGLFVVLLDRNAPAEMQRYVLDKGRSRLAFVSEHLADREFLLDEPRAATGGGGGIGGFSVADAYLVTVLNWTRAVPALPLKDWPVLAAYFARLCERPSVMKALQEEGALYAAERSRHAERAQLEKA